MYYNNSAECTCRGYRLSGGVGHHLLRIRG